MRSLTLIVITALALSITSCTTPAVNSVNQTEPLTPYQPAARDTLTLKPGGRDVGKSLQKQFRSLQEDTYTKLLAAYSVSDISAPVRATASAMRLDVEAIFYPGGTILTVFRPQSSRGQTLQLVHFAEQYPETDDSQPGAVRNLGFAVFDYEEQEYYYLEGSQPLATNLLVTVQGRGDTRNAFRLTADQLTANYAWLTFETPRGGVRQVTYTPQPLGG